MSSVNRFIRGLRNAGEIMCGVISAEFTKEAQQRMAKQGTEKTAENVSAEQPASEAPTTSAPAKMRIPTRGWF